ncbi:MAG: response regulator [Candidatus Caenarcaniphilales bacterium]|nr:response regulator [Candidatus Caenarcaniphilales bacterium]
MSKLSDELINVLIVDDEPLIRMDLKEMLLESLVYNVIGEAKDGEEAIKYLQESEPDIIFMDIRMPNLDGISAAKAIQENASKRIPIIMLTAYSQTDLVEQAGEAGVFAYLTKPLRKPDLVPAIEISLARAVEFQKLQSELDKLNEKITTRKLVERAKGLLMDRFGISEPVAYRRLQKEAMDKRMNLKEMSEIVLQTLTTP